MPEIPSPLPSEAIRRKLLAEQEALTQVVWSDTLTDKASARIFQRYLSCTSSTHLVDERVAIIRLEHADSDREPRNIADTLKVRGDIRSLDRLDTIAAISLALDQLAVERSDEQYQYSQTEWYLEYYNGDEFRKSANDILLSHRIRWVFVDSSLVARGNQEMFAAVVEPLSNLLSGDPKYTRVNNAFNKALQELSADNPGDALTDANSALQEFFTTMGVKGNSAYDQARNAVKQGLLTSYDHHVVDAVKSLTTWVTADRSQLGDVHNDGSDAVADDAWLAIHIVGSLILRLSGSDFRNPKTAPAPASEEVKPAEVPSPEPDVWDNKTDVWAQTPDPWATPSKYSDETPF